MDHKISHLQMNLFIGMHVIVVQSVWQFFGILGNELSLTFDARWEVSHVTAVA